MILQGTVVHVCNTSYLGGKKVQGQHRQKKKKKIRDSISTNKLDVVV
jgi:hypothetical protein